ncbi:MAG: BBP7 family outer membrane beta-barrel protein [Planctomycetota bacterium]
MNRQQLSLIVVLGLISSIPAFAAEPSEQGSGWRTSSEETASSTLSGKLYRNSADSNGSAPYVILDRWSVVRGYVAVAQGVELESCVGQQVSLQGTIKTLPGGDMPYMICQRVLSGNREMTRTRPQQTSAPIVRDQPSQEIVPQPELPTQNDMAADPAPRNIALPLREVVLESRSHQTADDSQDRRSAPSARRADPRRLRRPAVQSTNYQETLPTPIPAGEVHRSPMSTDPTLDPAPMEEGSMVSEGSIVSQGNVGCDSCGEGSCDNSCDEISGPCWGPRRPLFCWGPSGIWVKADYLQWWERGMHVPALATTVDSYPNATDNIGYIGEKGTQVLFGDEDINNKSRSGGRIQAGLWLNPCMTFGFEGEYLSLADETTDFRLWSDGNPIISRPFYDVGRTLPIENIEKVAYPRGYPGSFDGAIDIGAITRFHGAAAHFLFTTCRQEGSWTDECGSCTTYHDRYRAIFVAGYRYLSLEDQLGITENLTSTEPEPVNPLNPTGTQGVSAFLIHDQFNTQNSFNGADLGMKFEFQRNRWSLDMFPRIALGSTHSTVDITGSTRTTSPAGVQANANGGLLALPGLNIGHYSKDNFTVVPELDLNLGFQFTNHTRLVVGYNALYWNKVVRAGEQIDRTVNGTLLPNAAANGIPPAGDLTRPRFTFQETGFWAQGINVGLDCRW